MSTKMFAANFVNKSELIRAAYELRPGAKNKEIIKAIKDTWHIDVSQTLVIGAIGKFKNRIAKLPRDGFVGIAKRYLDEFKNDLDLAWYWLKKASKA